MSKKKRKPHPAIPPRELFEPAEIIINGQVFINAYVAMEQLQKKDPRNFYTALPWEAAIKHYEYVTERRARDRINEKKRYEKPDYREKKRARNKVRMAENKDIYNENRRRKYEYHPEYRQGILDSNKEYRIENIEVIAKKDSVRQREKATGWTDEEFQTAVEIQNGLCGCCKKPPGKKGLQADHCHRTGAKRMLLCSACNLWIGSYECDEELAKRRIAYANTDWSSDR